MSQSVLPAYGLHEESLKMESFGSGLINRTWKITTPENEYILQRVNQTVFEKPGKIAANIRQIAAYLKEKHPDYNFVAPLASSDGSEMIYVKDEGFFRLFPFVAGSHSKDVVDCPGQAYEAARQFGRFTRMLSGLDVTKLEVTIPSFHDLSLRYHQFLEALETGNKQRRHESRRLVDKLFDYDGTVTQYEAIRKNPNFKLRVTHHDTKISNVLFDEGNKGICVIDLDTVMPGYFISDVGDMMRTYLSPVSEEEKDTAKVVVRDDFYKAVVEGYYSEMKDELTPDEKACFFYAGKFMIYMQALRFFTDHLNNDVYYGARYEGHNLVRAQNQLALLERLLEKEHSLMRL
ncbi:MAG: aminoglycoside phosphotransferase family protein [Chitinophagaceae bacterium]|nr:MAG: aminoglycoside phosphotransferase family protein [Chitinophagaceae bacterium]